MRGVVVFEEEDWLRLDRGMDVMRRLQHVGFMSYESRKNALLMMRLMTYFASMASHGQRRTLPDCN